jgi:anthranilate synthase component II
LFKFNKSLLLEKLKKSISIAIVDNFDSFTFNLYHYLQPFADNISVIRNNELHIGDLYKYNGIVLSPGPGLPKNYPILKEIILTYGKIKPILGVCLGHQAIAETYGGKLVNLKDVWHGIERETIVVSEDELFKDIPSAFMSGRYHSWAVSDENIPTCLTVTARDSDETIMAIKHNEFPLKGIQFHPESILTLHGKKILENWVKTIVN